MSDGLQHFFNEVSRRDLLTPTQERDLAKRTAAGDVRAREQLIEHNIRLAIRFAKAYQNFGVELEDLIQEAILGLHRAADKFDYTRGYKFSTYATWWIRQSLQRAIYYRGRTIRVPAHIMDLRRRAMLYLRDHPEADTVELLAKLDCTEDHLELAFNLPTAGSLDAPLNAEGMTISHVLADETELGKDPALLFVERDERVQDALKELPEMQRKVIRLRFGFDGPVRGRAEVAQILDIGQHRVQKLQRAGLLQLQLILAASDSSPATDPDDDVAAVCSRPAITPAAA